MLIYQYGVVLQILPITILINIKLISNPLRIIFGQVNLNSVRNTYEQQTYIVNN